MNQRVGFDFRIEGRTFIQEGGGERDASHAEQAMWAEIERLQKQVLVPGVWRCAKCGFFVVSTEIHAVTGNFRANNKPQECANGCGPMWRVTWKDACKEADKRLDQLSDQLKALERAFAGKPKQEAAPELENCVALVCYFPTQKDADEFTALVQETKPGMVARTVT